MSVPLFPLREPTYFVLASLADGPLHGYGIITRAEGLSHGRVRLATGTLFTALDRLAAEGYVRLVSDEVVSGRARRSYGLTDAGATALEADAIRRVNAASPVTPTRRAARSGRVSPASAGQGRAAGPAGRKVRPA
jgi:PadR family transcriptional regulator PadR